MPKKKVASFVLPDGAWCTSISYSVPQPTGGMVQVDVRYMVQEFDKTGTRAWIREERWQGEMPFSDAQDLMQNHMRVLAIPT